MRDLKNMGFVDDQIRTDRIFTRAFSVAGCLIGVACLIFAIHVALR
jgi:hypothetical protein